MLAYCCYGESTKPALLLLHGFLGDKQDWQALMPQLSQHFYCICLDLPGHGDSPELENSPEFNHSAHSGFIRTAQQIKYTLAALNIHQFHLLGYSLGGRIALHLMQLMPDNILSITLESCHPGLTDETQKQQRLINDKIWDERLQTLTIEAFLNQWYLQGVFAELSSSQRTALIQRRSHNQVDGLRSIYLATSLALQQDLSQLPNLDADKTRQNWHYFVGEQDNKFLTLARRWQQQAKISIHTFANAGHNVHLASPEQFCHTLIDILQQEAP